MSDYPGLGSDPLPGPALCLIRPIPDGIEEERVREEEAEDEEGDEHPAEEARRAKKASALARGGRGPRGDAPAVSHLVRCVRRRAPR